MVSKTGEAESITSHYLFALGSYRALYILNWIYRYVMEDHYDLIAIVAGVVQTVLYCDFFYLYITKGELYISFRKFVGYHNYKMFWLCTSIIVKIHKLQEHGFISREPDDPLLTIMGKQIQI